MTTSPSPIFAALSLVALAAGSSSAALLSPILTTGYNADIVFESGLANGQTGINSQLGSRAFFQAGALGASIGLPANVSKSVGSGNTVNFNFQPFTANNALMISGANSNTVAKSLSFGGTTGYSSIGLVVSGGALNSALTGSVATNVGTLSYIINYVGGGTQTGSVLVGDWGNPYMAGTAETFFTAERVNEGTLTWPVTSSTDLRWKLFYAEIVPTSTAAIASIDFTGSRAVSTTDPTVTGLTGNGYNSQIAIFGAVGSAIPEPTSALLGAFAITAGLVRRRRSVQKS